MVSKLGILILGPMVYGPTMRPIVEPVGYGPTTNLLLGESCS